MTWEVVDVGAAGRSKSPYYKDGNVEITPTLAVLGDVTCAVATINSVFVRRCGDPSWVFKFYMAGFSIAAVLGIVAYYYITWSFFKDLAFFVTIIMVVYVAVYWYAAENRSYALVLSTSSGDKYALVGRDRAYLNAIRQHIETAMAAPREVVPASPPKGGTRECPRCAETIKAAALVCRFCGHEF